MSPYSNIYEAPLWYNHTQACYRTVKVAYNDIYRALFGIARGVSISRIYVTKGIDCFDVLVRKFVYSMWQRIAQSVNSILCNIFHSEHCVYQSSILKKWKKLLYVQQDVTA